MADYIQVDGLNVGVNMVRSYREQIDSLQSQLDAANTKINRLQIVRRSYKESAEYFELEAHAANKQLDAMRAQCERLREHANQLSFNLVHDDVELPKSSSEAFSTLQDVMAETPEQSLVEVKARAIERAAESAIEAMTLGATDWHNGYVHGVQAVEDAAARLRQQAKGGVE